MNDALKLMERDTNVTEQWFNEFVRAFTKENRAKFPANRDFLRTHAAQIIKLLDESSSLNQGAADKYEQAAFLSAYDQQQRGLASFASGCRKKVELNEILKSLMQTVSDETVADEKAPRRDTEVAQRGQTFWERPFAKVFNASGIEASRQSHWTVNGRANERMNHGRRAESLRRVVIRSLQT